MFRKVLLTIGLLLLANAALLAQGTLKGTVTDSKTGEPIGMANVLVKQNGQLITGSQTDFDGIYTVKALPVGKYDVEVSYVGYKTFLNTGVDLRASGFTVVNVSLNSSAVTIDVVEIKEARNPIIQMGEASSGTTMSSSDIERMPATNVDAIVAAVGGVGYSDGGTSTARGEDGMVTMQNGVRKRTGINVPKEAIASIQVILGGTPASIGEAVGGTQVITLKPPESQFHGMVKDEAYLDYRLYDRFTLYLTGPLLKKKETLPDGGQRETTFLGFRFTTQASFSKFGYRRAKEGRYQVVKDSKVQELENTPIIYDPENGRINYAAEYLGKNDFVTITRPTAKNYYASANRAADFASYSAAGMATLMFRFSDYTNLELTGEYTFSKGASTDISYFPFNLTRAANGTSEGYSYAITAEFSQRFPDEKIEANSAESAAKSAKAITNVMWNASLMFNRSVSRNYNSNFGDHIFEYGHIGVFTTEKKRSYELHSDYNLNGTPTTAYVQNSWQDNVTSFTPSEYNPILANYTTQVYNIWDQISAGSTITFDDIRYYKGLINGGSPSSIYGLFSNVGIQNTTYAKSDVNYYYGQIKAAATVKGNHDIELGFQYDQSTTSAYSLGAYSLWTIMRQQANAHITQLNIDDPHVTYDENGTIYVNYNRLVGGGQTTFDESMRSKLGAEAYTWLDIDRYTPEWYEQNGGMNMFSASDLFNSGNTYVSYYGYDHTGARYKNTNWSLDDFFDPEGQGHKKYQYLPSFSPIYMAGYIQDKFYLNDLIFNVGVRVDRFDGNQMVLKDPYLLYDSYTVGDLENSSVSYNTTLGTDDNNNPIFPNNAESDWVVYVQDASAGTPTIVGYRSGSTWYDVNGVELSSPVSSAAGRPTPFRTTKGQTTATEGNASGNKVSSEAFEDYNPQVVVMPRLAFSFPVGEKSQFKASYDIIARRPSSGWQADYLSYLYMTQISTISNPNLKPERITNYELGFQQALNEKTAISISAYYKETRDLIQLVQYAGADPNPNYYSYDNIDFKTTKGFTIAYDLRQSQNIRINANYTLQYAEGTGLSTTTMSELIKEGYTTLKMLNPISDDRRHEFKANIDYRFEDGKGPAFNYKKKNKETGEIQRATSHPLQNFGVNLMAIAQSGRPYTKAFSNVQNTIVGSYRGARLPWSFYINAIVDKTWPINVTKKNGGFRKTFLNASLNITNLFDTRNVLGVFSVTGNPTDNGYLTDPATQAEINAYLDPQSYRDMYTIYLNNSYWNYSTPRTIILALTYSF